MPDHQIGEIERIDASDLFARKAEAELEAAGNAADRRTRAAHLNRAAEYATMSERRRSS